MIRLFRNTETDFSHNEFVISELISCKVTEEINGDFTVELEHPLEDSKNISRNLVTSSILSISTIDFRENQLFRIIKKESTSNTITVQAQAKLLADLKENRIKSITITGKTRTEAIGAVLNSCLDSHPYKTGSLDTNSNRNAIVNAKEGNPLNAIIGSENSVLSEYGGEFIVDNSNLNIIDQRGQDNGVVIEYGKNISSIKENINITDLATVLIPKSGDYRLPEYYIESPNVNQYEKRYFKDVDLNLNIWDGTNTKGEGQITIDEAYTIMRNTCDKMFQDDKVDQVTFNYTIDFVQLSQTEEYKNYKNLESVSLGDTVYIKHKKLNLNLKGRVNKIIYSVDSEGKTTIDTVEIGFSRKNITDIIKDAVKQIKFAKDEILLSVNNSVDNVTSEFKIADNAIKESIVDLTNNVTTELNIQNGKISAVVETNDGGMTWTLSKDSFIVACKGASNSNTVIDGSGLTVNNGKIQVKNSSSKTVFYVNTSGKCNADGGFIVDDGDSKCRIGSTGITMTNEDGYTSSISVSSPNSSTTNNTTLVADDDFEVTKILRAKGTFRAYGYTNLAGLVDIGGDLRTDGDVSIDGTLTIGGKTLQQIIDARINALK